MFHTVSLDQFQTDRISRMVWRWKRVTINYLLAKTETVTWFLIIKTITLRIHICNTNSNIHNSDGQPLTF